MIDFWSALMRTIDGALIQATALTAWEAVAVVLAAAYLILADRKSVV